MSSISSTCPQPWDLFFQPQSYYTENGYINTKSVFNCRKIGNFYSFNTMQAGKQIIKNNFIPNLQLHYKIPSTGHSSFVVLVTKFKKKQKQKAPIPFFALITYISLGKTVLLNLSASFVPRAGLSTQKFGQALVHVSQLIHVRARPNRSNLPLY